MKYYNLTTPQKNIWNLQKYYGDTAIGNQCGAIFYKEKRDNNLLKKAIYHIIDSQSGLRLRFVEKEEPVQYIAKELEDIPVMSFATMDKFDDFAENFAKNPIGLNDKVMYRFVVFQIGDRSGILAALSHLISDAWTFSFIAGQVDEIYHNLEDGADYDIWQADYTEYVQTEKDYFISERYKKDKSYWESKYTAQPEKSIIKMLPAKSDSIEAKRFTKCLSEKLENKINKYCSNNQVTQAVLFETALITYLAKINGENQTITIGIPVLNRSNAKEKKIAGMFVSTMPLTVQVIENMTITELAQQISKGHMEIFRHQKYPYSDILKYLREKQNFSGNLYDVMISYQNAKTDTEAETKWYSNGYSEVPFVVHIDNRDGKSTHTINVDYQTAVFKDEREVEYIVSRLEYIIAQIVYEASTDIKGIDIIPQEEKNLVLEQFNDTYVQYPREKCVHELFTEQAKKTPDKVALIAGEEHLTYCELDRKSDALAQKLIELGIENQEVVGVYLDRTAYTVISQIAVLKAGGVFLPIDHRYPKDRIDYMLNDCTVKMIITDKELNSEWNVEYLNLNNYDFDDILHTKAVNNRDDACYIIYTSGSTGKPKGCVLMQKGLANFCANNNIVPYAETLQHQTVVSVNTISFDFFIAETLLPLVHGWTVVLASEEGSNNKELFKELVKDNNVNIIETTPTRLELYTKDEDGRDSYFQQIQQVVSSGEALTEVLLQKIRNICDAKVFNPLGPSECSVWNVGGDFKTDITIGSPIANTQIYILDKNNKPLPIGVPGELCIAGEGVGKGYLNRPELTAEKFVPNPFVTEENHHGKIMYHTGDLACWRTDGEIEYLGRIDTQVKIRGLRIELGEIENVMSGFAGIQLTAVADKRDENNRQYLVGYYTSEQNIDEKELRSHLSSKLPKYMIPNYFMRLDTMPMTASGKTDRKNLPVPDFTMQEREYVEPESLTEKKLANIWEKYLQLDKIGKTDDFFECGGDSLLAISMISEIEEAFGVQISIKDIMENSVLENLAKCIENADSIVRIKANNSDKYKLLPQQKALYVTYSKNTQSLAYNMPARIRIPNGININRLKDSIIKAVRHHKILFSHIESDGNELIGVYDNDVELVFEQYDKNEIDNFVRPFDLSKSPLVRVGITENEILFDMHHIVADGETLNIILKDILGEYDGKNVCDEKITYGDYAEYFYKQDMTRHKEYFKKQLKCDFESVVLQLTKTPVEKGCSKVYEISESTISVAKNYARKHNMTDTMVCFGAYGILLSKYSGKSDVLSSIVLKNRIYADTKDMAGMFVNTLPVYIGVSGSVNDYMQRIKNQILGLFEHQELPFALIADTVGIKDKSVINTSFVYQADGDKSFSIGKETLIPEPISTNASKFDLMMELTPVQNGLKVRMEFDGGKYDEALMDRLIAAYERILEQLDKENMVDIEVMSPEEYHKVIEEFNDTYVEYPREKCVQELFAEQAKKTPDKIALIAGNKKYTYREINEKSDALAQKMINLGIREQDVVGTYLDRTAYTVISQIAVLKAGGVFLPIDHRYPKDRIDYMLNDCAVKLILTDKELNNEWNVEYLNLDNYDFDDVLHTKVVNNSDDACYIIYTSGSTGKPKGCVLMHKGLANFCANNNIVPYAETLSHQTVVSVNTISFDYFIAETLLPLVHGWTVVIASEEESTHKDLFEELIRKHRVNIIETTPTRLEIYTKNEKEDSYFQQIQLVVTSGEALTEELLKHIRDICDAKVFNPLGPSECSVWNVGGDFKTGVTIGSPIANTQIYILDKNNKPLPIGVPGELCIAGEGVGKGYLNRPELTAEKFVTNPFATEENHHGKIMYHTGDLACWRADGEIEYLGRIDTQVKIRGLRIELGEIENVMSGFAGIQLTAVADKRDENNHQYLVGYYTSEQEIDEKKLRIHLSSKLAKYMIPNYFMRLDTMPMTASGKIDRKNLPVPDFTTMEKDYVAPATEMETNLCKLLGEILHIEKVGVEDDFFEYGGDSLGAIEYVAKAHGMGVEMSLQNVFDYPTVRSLCDFLQGEKKEKVQYKETDFDKYKELFDRNVIKEGEKFEKKSLGNVLLTGATGFLGAHILNELMQKEIGKIYCLVRSNKADDRRGRLREILKYYFGDRYESEINKRIIPIIGDIEQKGLSDEIPTDVQTVIHTAASVKHYGSYSYFNRINTEGTAHVVEYAKKIGANLIHISTLSVSGNSMADDFSVYHSDEEKFFYETSLYIGQPLDNVYIHSKFEAERKVYDAMLEGLNAKVIRVGNLTNRASDYMFQPNYTSNAFLTRVKAILEFGLFPDYLMNLYAEFSPIDKTAEGIVKIAQYADKQCVFHLNSNKVIYFERFLEVVHKLGISMEVVSGAEFNRALQETIKKSNTEYIFEAFQNDMDEQGKLVYDSNIRIKNDFTLWFLEKVGFEWNETDMEYISGYVDYFRKIGYLEV
ncbi:amino acid adenylation domain-containing protein [Lachnospira hominis (ex Hitch et al. 2024)]|uniref:Amino acid adenylation domain-containing protein n=1 Tax=Lachnospira intestinalis TaxID=3133158 RepID=A0ABV1GL04_9FIRM